GGGDDIGRGHMQNDRSQGGTQNFWIGKFWACFEILFGIQSDGNTRAGTTCTAGALLRGGVRDACDGERLDFCALGVSRDTSRSGIDHVCNAGNGQGRFGYVGGQYDASVVAKPEDSLLILQGQPPK